ncbi:MAG TPA: Na+/H+ antiporter NhaA [Acidimicrobiales bacterium]|nr:Na+/H+ antiporter NhaA [Acidimicrobiales bacterium]
MALLKRRRPPAVPPVRAPRIVREFLTTEAAGGVALLVAAAVALVWANSPWREAYQTLWGTEFTVRLGRWAITEDLTHWVNDALMALFFFVVGLEIKRELVAGELREWRTAALPGVAAAGGMVMPALIYLAVNPGGEAARGWGIPVATDIAFAVGVLSLLGRRVPGSAKLFLLTLAVVDDIGAILIIAIFYSGGITWLPLGVAAALLGMMFALRTARVRSMAPYAVLGAGVWLAVFESGLHATLAGVVLGLLAPARPVTPEDAALDWAADLQEDPTRENLRTMTQLAKSSVSVTERLERELHPWTSFLVIPIFALANAGVTLDAGSLSDAATSGVGIGVALGLVVGKVAGITGAVWLAVRTGLAALPEGTGWLHMVGVAAVAGIGFTVSIFVTGLAFDSTDAQEAAKIAILAASVVASALGVAVLRAASRKAE